MRGFEVKALGQIAAQDAVTAWYTPNDIDGAVQQFAWIGRRGMFTRDPEGNTIERLACDASMLDSGAALNRMRVT